MHIHVALIAPVSELSYISNDTDFGPINNCGFSSPVVYFTLYALVQYASRELILFLIFKASFSMLLLLCIVVYYVPLGYFMYHIK